MGSIPMTGQRKGCLGRSPRSGRCVADYPGVALPSRYGQESKADQQAYTCDPKTPQAVSGVAPIWEARLHESAASMSVHGQKATSPSLANRSPRHGDRGGHNRLGPYHRDLHPSSSLTGKDCRFGNFAPTLIWDGFGLTDSSDSSFSTLAPGTTFALANPDSFQGNC